jgi:hypothetical protein
VQILARRATNAKASFTDGTKFCLTVRILRASLPQAMHKKSPHLWMLAASLVALGLSMGAARADEPGQDEVTLKNGGSIRGTIVSSEPGTSVKIIEVGQTQPRVIPWSQVSDVEKGKYAPKTATQPGPAGPGYVAPPAPPPQPQPEEHQPKLGDPGVVRLHIETPIPATVIEHRYALIGTYRGYGLVLHGERNVCSSPCDKIIDGSQGSEFRLADNDFPSGGSWSLATMKGDVTLRVEPGSKPKRTGGGWMLALGTTAAVTGALVLPFGQIATTTDANTGKDLPVPNYPVRNAGIGLLVGGVAVLGVGIALVVTGATNVTLTQGAPPTGAKAASAKPRYWMGEF